MKNWHVPETLLRPIGDAMLLCLLSRHQPGVMNSNAQFVLKVLIASTAVSVLLKYGGPTLSIPPTSASALIGVFLLPVLLAAALCWRAAAAQG
jgi:hypothetical protein